MSFDQWKSFAKENSVNAIDLKDLNNNPGHSFGLKSQTTQQLVSVVLAGHFLLLFGLFSKASLFHNYRRVSEEASRGRRHRHREGMMIEVAHA